MVGEPGATQVHASAVGARLHRFLTEVSGHDALSQLRPPRVAEAHQVFSGDQDHACVPATTRGAGEAVELFGAGFEQSNLSNIHPQPPPAAAKGAPRFVPEGGRGPSANQRNPAPRHWQASAPSRTPSPQTEPARRAK
jgi:hypothetical protein